MIAKDRKTERIRRRKRIRARISGTSKRPRLSVFKSNKYLYVQLIDDDAQKTILSSSEFSLKGTAKKTREERIKLLGQDIMKKAKAKKIGLIVFDRGGFPYTGNIKKLATLIREGGLIF